MFEGEHDLAKHNTLLGTLEFKEVPRSLVGFRDVAVTFDIDEHGNVLVSGSLDVKLKSSIRITVKMPKPDPVDQIVSFLKTECQDQRKRNELVDVDQLAKVHKIVDQIVEIQNQVEENKRKQRESTVQKFLVDVETEKERLRVAMMRKLDRYCFYLKRAVVVEFRNMTSGKKFSLN